MKEPKVGLDGEGKMLYTKEDSQLSVSLPIRFEMLLPFCRLSKLLSHNRRDAIEISSIKLHRRRIVQEK